MNVSVGIVGLPNVGKSTLFNALLKRQVAYVANYPFATIEPNIGVVPVPDERLNKLSEVEKEENKMEKLPPIIPATVQFVDIAGLVKGAAEGAGLGNKFLSHIREVSIIAHVVRAFSDESIIKEGSVDPKSDYETIQTELSLADISTVEKIANTWKSRDKFKPTIEQSAADKLLTGLNKGIPARDIQLTEEEEEAAKQFFLLSKKPEIVVLNVSEEDYTEEKIPNIINQYSKILHLVIANEVKQSQSEKIALSSLQDLRPSTPRNDNIIVICAKIEAELAELSVEEQKEYLKDLGLQESGLERLIKNAYKSLGLISFLTAGEKEVRAWTIKKGINAQNASGIIHNDFIKNFIKAEIVSFDDFVQYKGWKGAREQGKARMEGRDYIVKDNDIIEFKIGK